MRYKKTLSAQMSCCLVLLALIACGGSSTEDEIRIIPSGSLGGDFLAGMHKDFPVGDALKLYDGVERPFLGLLYLTFGNSEELLIEFKLSLDGRTSVVRIHISNEACRRNERCQEFDFLPELSVDDYNQALETGDPSVYGPIGALIESLAALLERHKAIGMEQYISTGLENNFTPEAECALIAFIRSITGIPVVSNPLYFRDMPCRPDVWEFHGITAPVRTPCISSLDGVAPFQEDQALADWLHATYNQCIAGAVWYPRWQGIDDGPFVAPALRRPAIGSEVQKFITLFDEVQYGN